MMPHEGNPTTGAMPGPVARPGTRPGNGVLHVATELGWRGGEQQAYLLMRGLQARGVRQALLAPADGAFAERCRTEGLAEVIPLPARGRYAPTNLLATRGAAERFAPALLHAHTSHAHALAWAAGPRHMPVVVTRRVDFPPKWGVSLGRRYTSPRVFSIAISQAIRDLLLKFGCPAGRVFLVPSGIDPARFAAVASPQARANARAAIRQELGIGDDTFLIGNTAALTDHKGHAFLLEALALLAREHAEAARTLCVIAGKGELEEKLRASIGDLKLDDPTAPVEVRLLGFRNDVAQLLAAFDLFVQSSHLEGLGTAVLDAMCLGLPIVATTAGGLVDILTHDKTALLVPPRDAAALAVVIGQARGDVALRARLGAGAARAFATGPNSAEAMVEGNLGVYRQVLATWAKRR